MVLELASALGGGGDNFVRTQGGVALWLVGPASKLHHWLLQAFPEGFYLVT